MNGSEVFTFTLERVPPLIDAVLQQAGWTLDEVEYFVPHQANLFMLQHLAKRMKVPVEKLVVSLDEFGNTSCASIPLAIGHRLSHQVTTASTNLLMAGFGVGWSWGALAVSCGPMVVPAILELAC
jgi:3-oxoacyl-[acyl-carrier-protein] synthase-3